MTIRILDVGQCGVDAARMAGIWQTKLSATVDRCHFAHDALERITRTRYDLILVNRVLDVDNSSGLDLIRDMIKSGTSTPVMLVSNYSEAQKEAVALGAIHGFGKADLDKFSTVELVKRATSSQKVP
ncbi:response regulator [Schlesneria paludicola]|uniref:response regulator n=1 Tax=Schlesneria paludicola TaxID=360056 RepID=UPI00029AC37D|nr:response regulator [Schlesneria paludicola]